MTKKIITKIIATICCFALILSVVAASTPVEAAKTIQDYKKEQAAAKKELDRLKAEKADKMKIPFYGR